MEFEWDGAKRRSNIHKHGIDFLDAKDIWQGNVLEIPSPQWQHGEQRHIALGVLKGRVIAVVLTWRSRRRHLISARMARDYEKAIYQSTLRRRS